MTNRVRIKLLRGNSSYKSNASLINTREWRNTYKKTHITQVSFSKEETLY